MFANCGLCFAVMLIQIRETLLLCDNPNGYLEIEKEKINTFTDSGVSQDLEVQWKLNSPIDSNPQDIGECPGGSNVCTSQVATTITFSRTSNTVSVTINEPAATNKQIFWTMNLLLLTFSGSTLRQEKSCPFDFIDPPVGASCTVHFSGTTWRVTGFCNVTQVLSKRGRYYCRVYQVNQEPSSAQSLVGNFTMTTSKKENTEYVDGYCQINLKLPPVGKYNYSIVIVPGERQVFPVFDGSNEIKLPRFPFHNCSQTITEGQTLKCSCNVRELGNPPGSPVWKGTTSSELQLSNVNRTHDGMVYSCTVMWNNTAIEQENYTLRVNYPSSVVKFQIDNKESQTVNVTENSNISVICRADGRPLPTISLLKQSSNNKYEEMSVATNATELNYSLSVNTCETAGYYLCTSNNNIGSSKKESLINVFCAPRRKTNDTYIATFKDQEAKVLFGMIAYPPPDALSIFDETLLLNMTIYRNDEKKNFAQYSCVSEKLYMVFCNLTLYNQTVFHAGSYNATFKTSNGNVTFMFEIKEETYSSTTLQGTQGTENYGSTNSQATENYRSTNSQTALAAGLGAGLGLTCIIVVVLVVVILRLRRKLSGRNNDSQPQPYSVPIQTAPENNAQQHVYDQMPLGDIKSQSSYQNLECLNGEEASTNKREENADQDEYHIYEVPKEENRDETAQEDVYKKEANS